MPYQLNKLRNKTCYRVTNPTKHKIFAKCTTLKNATKQIRLLRALQYNKSFVPRAALQRKLRTQQMNRRTRNIRAKNRKIKKRQTRKQRL